MIIPNIVLEVSYGSLAILDNLTFVLYGETHNGKIKNGKTLMS